jgi:hypothetical protein
MIIYRRCGFIIITYPNPINYANNHRDQNPNYQKY